MIGRCEIGCPTLTETGSTASRSRMSATRPCRASMARSLRSHVVRPRRARRARRGQCGG
jgi:hypothetical protein